MKPTSKFRDGDEWECGSYPWGDRVKQSQHCELMQTERDRQKWEGECDRLRAENSRYRACLLLVQAELAQDHVVPLEWQRLTLLAVREALESTNDRSGK